MDRASAIETEDCGSIPGRVKAKTILIGIQFFPAWRIKIGTKNYSNKIGLRNPRSAIKIGLLREWQTDRKVVA